MGNTLCCIKSKQKRTHTRVIPPTKAINPVDSNKLVIQSNQTTNQFVNIKIQKLPRPKKRALKPKEDSCSSTFSEVQVHDVCSKISQLPKLKFRSYPVLNAQNTPVTADSRVPKQMKTKMVSQSTTVGTQTDISLLLSFVADCFVQNQQSQVSLPEKLPLTRKNGTISVENEASQVSKYSKSKFFECKCGSIHESSHSSSEDVDNQKFGQLPAPVSKANQEFNSQGKIFQASEKKVIQSPKKGKCYSKSLSRQSKLISPQFFKNIDPKQIKRSIKNCPCCNTSIVAKSDTSLSDLNSNFKFKSSPLTMQTVREIKNSSKANNGTLNKLTNHKYKRKRKTLNLNFIQEADRGKLSRQRSLTPNKSVVLNKTLEPSTTKNRFFFGAQAQLDQFSFLKNCDKCVKVNQVVTPNPVRASKFAHRVQDLTNSPKNNTSIPQSNRKRSAFEGQSNSSFDLKELQQVATLRKRVLKKDSSLVFNKKACHSICNSPIVSVQKKKEVRVVKIPCSRVKIGYKSIPLRMKTPAFQKF